MKQALHIFRKDVDALRIEIGVFILLALAFGWQKLHAGNDEWSDVLVALAASFLIARAVHGDGIPGNRQFWLTRPYNRMSLLSAKLLFVLVCVSLPVACAQLAVALRLGYPLRDALAAVLFNQLALLGIGALPLLALSALTPGIIVFTVIAMAVALVSLGGSSTLLYWHPGGQWSIPGSVEWIQNACAEVLFLGTAAIVIFRQYRDRATRSSIVVAIAGLNIAAAVYVFLPAPMVLRAQSLFSKNAALSSGIAVSLKQAVNVPWLAGPIMRVPLTLAVDHIPPGVEVRADDLNISVSWPGRPLRFAQQPGVERSSEDGTQAIFALTLPIDPALARERYNDPLTITGSLWLTIFGDDERRRISLRSGRALAQDGLACESFRLTDRARAVIPPPGSEVTEWHPADSLTCAALFRWPSKLVYAESGAERADFSNTLISYSPFPARVSLDPVEARWAGPIETEDVTIVTRRPLVHFRRNFGLTGIRLRDFEPRRMFLHAPPPPHR
jgi:hypothetical protein